jgi:cbb3-type cytochrome oxidase cytochrome c subunit
MDRPRTRWRLVIGGILVLTLFWLGTQANGTPRPVVAGSKPAPTMTAQQKAAYKALLAAGKKGFLTVGCSGCHMLSAAGSTGGAGPSLNHIGKIRSAKWILAQIADPCAPGHEHAAGPNYSCLAMPPGLARGKTAQAIAAFLAAQK